MNCIRNKISVVVPVYMGKTFLSELSERVGKACQSCVDDYELILVNDASPDDCWPDIRALCQADSRIKGLNLSKNFGQHYAITAGLAHATGEWIVVMDCDLQDVPEEIPRLYARAKEGFDTVFARRVDRQDSFIKRYESWIFYKIFGYLTDAKLDASIANFGIYHGKVVEAILAMGDAVRYLPTMSLFVGFRQTSIPVQHASRTNGRSSYSFIKLLKLALANMIAFSNKPLRLFAGLGFWISLMSMIIFLVFLTLHLLGKIAVLGWASLILSIWFVGGLMMFGMGIIGIYLGLTFNQSKRRPLYFVEERINLENGEGK